MGYGIYKSEVLTIQRIMVAGGGMMNGNAYAEVEIHYTDGVNGEVDSIWYKEYGHNPVCRYIGDEVEWDDEGSTFKVKHNGEYVDDEDKEDEDKEDEDKEDEDSDISRWFDNEAKKYDILMEKKYPNWSNMSHRERKNLSPPSSDDEEG